MGRIKKTASEKHEASVVCSFTPITRQRTRWLTLIPQSPYISDFIKQTVSLPLHKLPKHIATFPVNWPFPRGDLYHWIPTFNRFDGILELFVKEYALDQGPQTQPFELRLLEKCDGEDGSNTKVTREELMADGYSEDGDRQLMESILHFTRTLLERCGNRSLYASSSHLNHLLNSVSLSLLKATLRVTLRLAQRYHTSRVRMGTPHTLSALLAGHYAISLDRMQKLANPFPKKAPLAASPSIATPFKSKAKSTEDAEPVANTADIAAMVKAVHVPARFKQELSGVHLTYYEQTSTASAEGKTGNPLVSSMGPPATPTPTRRRSNLGPGSASRPTGNDDTPTKSVETPDRPDLSEGAAATGPKLFEIPASEISTQPDWKVVKDHTTELPQEYQFDLLHRVRVASAFNASKTAVDDLVAVRILAIANLAYVYSESHFSQKIAQPDSEEPRNTQLAQQLTELLQPPSDGQQDIPKDMIVTVIMALEALTKTKAKSSEVTQALNISVSHGVLFYVLRKVQATLAEENLPFEEYEWCKDMLDLVQSLAQPTHHQQRNADAMVSAGFIGILVDILTLRTKPAQVYFPAALHLIDTFIHNGVRDAFTSLVNAKGLDVLADLTAQEVKNSVEAVERGEGFPVEYRAQSINYKIPFIDQLILRQLLKFIAHMYAHSVGTNDRLLRNLIDSPQLLGALKTVISNAELFGSNVWSGAINILSSFIHNEPTSYQVIAEAGLSKMFLEAITRKPITVTDLTPQPSEPAKPSEDASAEAMDTSAATEPAKTEEKAEENQSNESQTPAQGILPVGETMRDIPPVFGAICLNENGFRMFEASDALEKFLEIFMSPDHVKAMEDEKDYSDIPNYIGQSLNELVRHHDQLKQRVAASVLDITHRVLNHCYKRAALKGVGAKLWVESDGKDGSLVAGGLKTLKGVRLEELKRFAESNEHNYQSAMVRELEAQGQVPDEDYPTSESQLEDDELVNDRTHGRTTSDFIAVLSRFLKGYLSHSKTYTPFIEQGGADLLLDLAMAPCNPYNFHQLSTCEELSQVIQGLVFEKPQLILPSLVKRTQLSLRQLKPLVEHPREHAYFKSFTVPGSRDEPAGQDRLIEDNGTYIVKAMVSVHALVSILSDVLMTQSYYENRSRQHNLLSQVNLTDLYADLVDSLAKLHSTCIWEEIMMQNSMPDDWREETRVKATGYDNTEANKVMGMDTNRDATGHAQPSSTQPKDESAVSVKEAMHRRAEFKNTQILTYLLSQIPVAIATLFQALGKSLLSKSPRSQTPVDAWQKQNALTLAEHLAAASVDQLKDHKQANFRQLDSLAYDIVALSSIMQMIVDKHTTSRTGVHSAEILTLILRKFVEKGGLAELSQRLQSYRTLITEHKDSSKDKLPDDHLTSSERIHGLSLAAMNLILDFYAKITNAKNIGESGQTTASFNAHRDRAEFFIGPQLVIELRNAILPTVTELWNDEVILALPTSTVKDTLELLRGVLEGEGEIQAIRRAENLKKKVVPEKKKFKIKRDHLNTLVVEDWDRDLVVEALYRCNNHLSLARDYCKHRKTSTLKPPGAHVLFTYPPPEEDLEEASRRISPAQPSSSTTPADPSSSIARVPSVEMHDVDNAEDNDSDAPDLDLGQGNQRALPQDMAGPGGIAQVLSHALNGGDELLRTLPSHRRISDDGSRQAEVETEEKYVTIEDLDEKRKGLRSDLIDRCLDILNAHNDTTFELADLITAAAAKGEGESSKAQIGDTLVQSLMSLRPDEDVEPEGKKIASYAHLVALVLSQRDFFEATLDVLKDNFEFLEGFIRINPGQKPDETSPWIGNILAIVELVLAEDEQPQSIQWSTPDYNQPYEELPIAELKEPMVSFEEKSDMFEALLEILPKIGKDTALAVAVVRVLIYLTRRRPLAKRLSDKKAMTRLFSMMKQLAASAHERLQVDFMVLLRHIMEDDDTIRQVMRTEIQAFFENNRSSRPLDTTAYVRSLGHVALRNTELFVEMTNEMVQLAKWEPNRGPQHLMLKKEEKVPEPEKSSEKAEQDNSEDVSERPTLERTKTADLKPPVVENPDGVVQFLLSELSKYRDVDDKEEKPEEPVAVATTTPSEPPVGDVDMADSTAASSSETATSPPAQTAQQPPAKANDKDKHLNLELHPIYVYRCFIMACLTELLASYNRTKVEFINFSRKAEYQTSTPSKPRSGLLNYLLYNLVPTGSLSHASDVNSSKRETTSFWATSVLVSLTAKTNEKVISFSPSATGDEEPDLVYVRKFVLEHALKAYKDATGSAEPLEQKYSRLLSLSDLFNRMLTGKPVGGSNAFYMDMLIASQKHLGRLMYEKNFISALTSSIAEIDLNFPNAKRAVKYILRPMKWLTDIGVTLSTSSDYSSSNPTTTEEDEISSATSVSDDDQEREETPDLFRNSTLGMFEPGHDDDDEDDEEDDEEEDYYGEDYDEEMDYEEDPGPEVHEGDVVSDDDDDDIDGMGEIEGMPGDVPMELEIAMDDDDDESGDDIDDDSDMDDDDGDDDDDDVEIIDEITGDDENASMAEDDDDENEEGWEDEDALDEYDDDGHLDIGSPHGGPLEHMVRVLDGDDRSDVMDHFETDDAGHMMDMGGDQYFEDEMPDEDGELQDPANLRELMAVLDEGGLDDQDEEDYGDEEDVIYEPEIEGELIDPARNFGPSRALQQDLQRLQQSLQATRHELNDLLSGDLRRITDEDENEGMGWGWDETMPPGAVMRTHHHHHGHRGNPFTMAFSDDIFRMFTALEHSFATSTDYLLAPTRSHGRTGTGRGNEDGTNPLLQRTGRNAPARRTDPMPDWTYDGPPGRLPGGHPGGRDGPLSFVSDLIQMVGPRGARVNIIDSSGGALNFAGGMPPIFHIAGGPGGGPLRFAGGLRPPSLSRFASFFGGRGGAGRLEPSGHPSSPGGNDPSRTVAFTPTMTHDRWKDEAKVIYGTTYVEKAVKIVNSILRLLVPPAQEAKRQRDKTDAERRAADEKAREETLKKEEAERLEREEREKKEREEQEAKEREEAEAAARERRERGEPEPAAEGMEGVEAESSVDPAAPAQPRVTTTIRGRELDITHLGIDLEYLDALPDDMREEVIMQQFAEQRSQEVQSGDPTSEINRDFLDALPPDIQQELIRSEAADRRRRERDEARRRAAASGAAGPAGAGDMDNADFFATLPAALRQNILMEADDAMLREMPDQWASEARAILRERGQRREAHEGRRPSGRQILDEQTIAPQEHRARRPVAQMLDKSGVATLLRLMFISLQGSARSSMHGVLSDICKNTQNRAEVISVLLQILQDGSADASALEKSFAQLNFRAKQSAADKTPKALKRTLTGQQIATANTDISPLMIVQQCLSTLTALSHDNPRVSSFFLSEHETSISQRLKQSKKGKAKESKASKYPLNALLTLLDRKTIIENSVVMENLAALLIKVTEPLKILLKKAKEAEKEKEKEKENAAENAPATDVAMGEGEGQASTNDDAPATAEGDKPAETDKKVEEKKKHRELTPPDVPEENLRLVVNIIAAQECNSKTFQSTLEIINHLSAIPGAKDTFGRELVHRAQQLGESVLQDLKQLLPQIESAKTGTDVQGAALANFSPASSHQTKLLRVLLALDYLFDPKHASGTSDRLISSVGEALAPKSREDLLSTLYETSTFVNLWSNLSNCLTAIRQRGNMSNVATILQPLIESFMVVCKNTTAKEPTIMASQELVVGTPPADSRIESLFFTFTDDHRKILNDLVRNNPKLLNGTFAVLAHNSKVLEFDNKRNFFNRKLHDRKADEQRVPHSTIQLNIRRDQIFMDSFKNLYYKSASEIKHGKLNIRFHGEEGVDAGGVTREWFGALSRQMFNADYALFNPVASDRTTFHPNPTSDINPEHLLFFKFIGRIIGKALYEGRVLDCHFTRAMYKRILGKAVNLKDMETLDLDYYKSLCWILENDITDITFESFSVEVDKFGEIEIIDLIPNGRDIPVTEENKQEYVKLVVEQRLTRSVEEQLQHFLQGFHEIIPADLVAIFSEQELELLISGLPDIDVDDWKNNTEYHNYQPTSPQIQWFWRAVRSFDKEEKAKLLQFVTGTSKVPLNGFKELEGMNGFSRFNIHRDFGNKERLPSSHTCFNQMDVPEYDSYEQLRKAIYTAMTQGSEYFGFA